MREKQKNNPPRISEKLRQLRAERITLGKSYANQVFDDRIIISLFTSK
ncbi:hypothetical protein [Dolichospermum circinale]|uniref:Uncharacterized protein n=1 Tax=Dolichospermum circinale CS-537/01 TaxID=3021739 RepID=A0ABT5A8I8_9CYAN|nr:hypothetical protein [Dolichospermum circinale]MDB9473259.1 hypothetical protein [Dolichospermum circinale CS-537/11]MDB9480740.1 hypothetical protein [Dolichospermum circinale CS-537/03]MDB9483764.1 hypothetical protein [Dolichospermum circinale CS-537/05]MDB9488270.1 hypothetical protein [Dolichospermum circinale CS-537/01]